jgi:hypothetical protein
VQQAGPLEVKADAQLGARQRGLAEPAARACGVARKSGDTRLEKRTTLLTNTAKQRPGFNDAYDSLELEYTVASQMLKARAKAGLT